MLNLYTFITKNGSKIEDLTKGEKASIEYHNIFDYPLSFAELIKWKCAEESLVIDSQPSIANENGYFFLEGRGGLIYKRLLRKRVSVKKLEIAKKASRILSFIPTVKMVAVTGSLAMENSTGESDIDLMIVARKNFLWTSRLTALLLLLILGVPVRRSGRRVECDKLCLNMWFDESDLVWRDRNIYTAHEIAQIVPLVNKSKTYEKLLQKNKWILNYWPNAVKVHSEAGYSSSKFIVHGSHEGAGIFEKLAFKLQYFYMRRKITREVVTPTRALFHPQDWGKFVLSRLSS